MDPIIAVYNIKLTVRSSTIEKVGLTNEEVGEAVAEGLADAISEQAQGDGDFADLLDVNATSVERTDD